MNLKCIIFSAILAIPIGVFSQQKITGKIIDSDNKAIDFAEIDLIRDSVVVKREFSNDDGSFLIEKNADNYKLQIRQLGKILLDTFIVLNKTIDLGVIKVDATHKLQEVIIEGKKKIIERKVDRIVFNVENDKFCQGLNAIEVLGRTPRIEIESNDAIKMIGKGNVRVMIDGRLLNDEEVKSRLKSLRAEDIAQIEVIPIPPAKYSAEGNSGMINIVLKKDPTLGLHGNANASLLQKEKTSSFGGINLNYRSKKFEMMMGVNYDITNGINENKSTYSFVNNTLQSNEYKTFNWQTYSFNSVLKYKLAKNMETGVTIDYNTMKSSGLNNCNTTYFNKITNKNDSTINTVSSLYGTSHAFALSAYYDYNIDTLGRKLSITYNHSSNENPISNDLTSTINTYLKQYDKGLSTDGKNTYLINSAMADLELPYKWAKIETGLSLVGINNNSNIKLYDVNGSSKVINSTGTNDFEYIENTYSAYLSASKDINKLWSVKVGLRYEYTDVVGYSPTMSLRTNTPYDNLFPSVFVLFNPNEKNSISFSYSKRIERPIFYDLNPFRYYSTVNSYTAGNAYLLPQLSNNLEINYTFNNNLNIVLWGYQLNKAIDYVSQFDSQDIQSLTAQNLYNLNKAGVYANYTIDLFKWWKVFCDGNVYYSESKSYKPELQAVGKNGYGTSASIRSNFVMNKKKNLLGEISFSQNFPSIDGMQYIESFASLNANLKYSILNDKLKFTLYASDILHQNVETLNRQYTTYNYRQICDSRVRNIMLAITYFFGNDKVNDVYKESKNTDKNRAGK